MTNEVCIIQGPPGTGKTFVGSKIVEMLIKAKYKFKSFEGPIFVVCYTNHALDQFLTHILDHTEKILRLGGGTKIENLKRFFFIEINYILEKYN